MSSFISLLLFSYLFMSFFPSFFLIMQVILIAADGTTMAVDKQIAFKSSVIRNMVNDLNPEGLEEDFEIPIPNVPSVYLRKIIDWCDHHRCDIDIEDDETRRSMPLDEWDINYLDVDLQSLYEIIMGADYLNIQPLLETACKRVANLIKGKTPEEIRRVF